MKMIKFYSVHVNDSRYLYRMLDHMCRNIE